MHEREMPAVAGRVKRGRRLGEMLADDPRIADLLVAERQLVMGEADRARVVRELRVLQRAGVKRDGARLLATGVRDAPMQAPQDRQLRIANRFAKRVRRAAERGRGPRET